MEKEFIPYKQALDLKELGFDEECLKCKVIGQEHLDYTPTDYDDFPEQKEKEVLIPTLSQAFRWFREKHNLEASIQRMPPEVYGKGKGDIKNYLVYIWAENLNPRGQQTLHFDTYEEAELECLKKLIEIVKK